MAAKVSKSRLTRKTKKGRASLSPVSHTSRSELESRHQNLLEDHTRLEISRARYAELFDAAPVGYVTLSRSGIIEEVNLMGAQLLGSPRMRGVSSPLVIFIAEPERRKFLRFLSQMRRRPGRGNVELELRNQSQGRVFVDLIAIPSVIQNDRLNYFQCALIDVSARQQAVSDLRASEEKFRSLANHAPVGIFLCDKNGDGHYANRMWFEITGLAFEHAQGKGWLKGVHPDDRDRIATAWNEAVHRGGSF